MGIEPMHCGFADRRVTTSPLHQNNCPLILIEILAKIKHPMIFDKPPRKC